MLGEKRNFAEPPHWIGSDAFADGIRVGYLVPVVDTWHWYMVVGKLGLLAAAATGLVDAFKDWPEDYDVVYGIKSRQRVAIPTSGGDGGGGDPASAAIVWDWTPPREAEDQAAIGFRAPAAMRYSYTSLISAMHTDQPC